MGLEIISSRVSGENLTQNERLDNKGPLNPAELARIFPYVERDFQDPRTTSPVFEFQPQKGEMVSFGVFFYAMSEKIERPINPTGLTLRVPTAELFSDCNLDPLVAKRGIIVAGRESGFYERLGKELAKNPKASQWGWIDEQIYKNFIVLNYRTPGNLPHLSIPASLSISAKYLRSELQA